MALTFMEYGYELHNGGVLNTIYWSDAALLCIFEIFIRQWVSVMQLFESFITKKNITQHYNFMCLFSFPNSQMNLKAVAEERTNDML